MISGKNIERPADEPAVKGSILTAEEKNRGMSEVKLSKSIRVVLNETRPAPIEETAKAGFVKWGDNNLYFEFLEELYYRSPTNNACVKGTARAIFGKGLYPAGYSKNVSLYAKWATLVKQDEIAKQAFEYKLYGMAAIVVRRSAANPENVVELGYWPMRTLRVMECNDKGEITRVAYSNDWANVEGHEKELTTYPIFGYEAEGELESIKIIRDFTPGRFYYAPPDYEGGTDWASVEIETGKFYINYIANGMYPAWFINFNNGVPSEAEQDEIESKIRNKFQGTERAGNFILAFNEGKENESSMTAFTLPEAASQFEFLSGESSEKVMLAHTITSPMLLGIKNNTGLGNNADELKTAFWLFMETVIDPMRESIIRAYEGVLTEFGIYMPLAFENTINPAQIALKATGHTINLSEVKEAKKQGEMTPEDEGEWMGYLEGIGEEIDAEWEEVACVRVDNPTEEVAHYQSLNLASAAGYDNPQEASRTGDSGLYKVRYRYAPARALSDSRSFCKFMTARSSKGSVYRLEDITKMGNNGVNGEFAPRGENTYSIWEWKGGVYCHHYWERVVYVRKRNQDGTFKEKSKGKDLENDRLVGRGNAGMRRALEAGVPLSVFAPPGVDLAGTKPIDTPTRGRLNFD
jgi:hypothetical protein